MDAGRRSREPLAFWTVASRGLRVLTVVMWITGLALFAVGWWLDTRGWWEHRPFVTNIASAFTGALFAIPVAVLVIQNIIRNETEWAQKRDAILLTRRTLSDLANVVSKLTRGSTGARSLKAALAELRVRGEDIIKWYEKPEEVPPIENRLLRF